MAHTAQNGRIGDLNVPVGRCLGPKPRSAAAGFDLEPPAPIAGHGRFRYDLPTVANGGPTPGEGPEAVNALDTLVDHSDPSSLQAPTPDQGGRYLAFETLGTGAMGVVYRAYDRRLDRQVALKLIRQTRRHRKRAKRAREFSLIEAQALARISHPNVVAVYDVGGQNEAFFMAMELVEGTSFDQWLKHHPSAPWRQRAQFFLEAARGLLATHQTGLIHRDIKPPNLLIGGDGVLRIVDFGLALRVADDHVALGQNQQIPNPPGTRDSSSGTSGTASICGTPAYMAPEQHLSPLVDARADQFSLCASFYEALYGRRAFAGETLDELARAKVARASIEGPVPRGAPQWLFNILDRGLAIDPEHRYPDLEALIADLEAGLARRRRSWIHLSCASVAAGLVTMALSLSPSDPCNLGPAEIHQVWHEAARGAIRDNLSSTKEGLDNETIVRVQEALAGYSSDWDASFTQGCRAHLTSGRSTAAEYDRQIACLHRGKQQYAALIDVLARGQGTVARNALGATASLPKPDNCLDTAPSSYARHIEALSPQQRVQVESLYGEIAKITVLDTTGSYAEALKVADDMASAVDHLDHAPLSAEYYMARGQVERSDERAPDSATSLRRALRESLRAGDQQTAARSAIALIYVVGYLQGRLKKVEPLIGQARALLEAAGGPRPLRAQFHSAVGAVRSLAGHMQAGYEELGTAHALADQEDPYHPDSIMMMQDFGIANINRGQFEDAERLFKIAIHRQQHAFGVNHPNAARTMHNLANAYTAQGQLKQALAWHERGFAMIKATTEEGSPRASFSYAALGGMRAQMGDNRGALALFLEFEAAAGHRLTGTLAAVDLPVRIMNTQTALGEFESATARWRGIEVQLQQFAEHWPNMPEVRRRIESRLHHAMGRHAQALAHTSPVAIAALHAADTGRARIAMDNSLFRSEQLLRLGRIQEAEATMTPALETMVRLDGRDHPLNWRARFLQARVWIALNAHDLAEAGLDRVEQMIRTGIAEDSHLLSAVHAQRAVIYQKRGQRALACQALRQALKRFDARQSNPAIGDRLRRQLSALTRQPRTAP